MTNLADAAPVSGQVQPPARTSIRGLLAQTEIDLRLFGMLVALGAILLTPAPAIVLLFALPMSWMAVVSLPLFSGVAPWVDNARALGQMTEYVMSATQWAHAGTSLAIWMVLPLLIGAWRITRREIAS